MVKAYIHPETGAFSEEPWTKLEAKTRRRPQWRDAGGCPDCGNPAPYRYVRSGVCVTCAAQEHSACYAALTRGEPLPSTRVWQHYQAFTLSRPCLYGPHLLSPGDECAGCEAERHAVAATRPQRTRHPARFAAAERGERTYRCDAPCKRGHDPVRYTSTGQCVECAQAVQQTVKVAGARSGKPRSADVEMALACPDMIISRADARAIGFKVYRTGKACHKGHAGWRYCATGGCVTCHLKD